MDGSELVSKELVFLVNIAGGTGGCFAIFTGAHVDHASTGIVQMITSGQEISEISEIPCSATIVLWGGPKTPSATDAWLMVCWAR